MNCRFLATGIAVAASIPLTPFVVKRAERFFGSNEPVVVTNQAWSVKGAAERAHANSSPWQRGNGHVQIILDASQSISRTKISPGLELFESIRNAYQSGDLLARDWPNTWTILDSNSDLYYLRSRYHDPSRGRFLSEDPTTSCAGISCDYTLSFWDDNRQVSLMYGHVLQIEGVDAAGNHYAARGEFSDAHPHFQISKDTSNWGGWYFVDGVLNANNRQPSSSAGRPSHPGVDFAGANTVQFAARGAVGGEKVEFEDMPFPDTAPLTTQSEHVRGGGWYSLAFSELPQPGTRLELEYVSIDGEHKRYTLTSSGTDPGKQVAWIYVNRPGSISVTAASSRGGPAIHGVGFTELVGKFREITFAKAELTVFLLCEVAPVGVWILIVCLLRWLTYRALQKLPRPVRQNAGHEIEIFLAVAKWAGVGCYGIWTFKDILTGVGIVLVR